ncbi:MAG: FAD:protein FMN transferase [Flavobacteriales bacterium]|nr:FAD:protein FMN transferase [Flavobacteriales bacterium]
MRFSQSVILTISTTFITIFVACKQETSKEYFNIQKNTQGTTLNIVVETSDVKFIESITDSVLNQVDLELSTYIDHSAISRYNSNSLSNISDEYPHLLKMLALSHQISTTTDGAFSPYMKNLMDYYRFDASMEKPEEISKTTIDSIMQIPRISNILWQDSSIKSFEKSDPRTKLDFNAIAQGYSVDLLAQQFEQNGLENYLIELGGEIKAKGVNSKNKPWRIGIDLPLDKNEGRPLHSTIELLNKSLATSGNYRKFYMLDGVKYAHTLNPITGYPAKNSLLSSTVIAESCAISDAFATSFMVMGFEKAKSFVEKQDSIEVILIYSDQDFLKTYYSPGLKDKIQLIDRSP